MGCPRRSLEVPVPIPCLKLDVDRRRCVDPGEAPKLEPVFGLRHCPLPPALQSEEHPFPAPSSSLGCCRIVRQLQAELGTGLSWCWNEPALVTVWISPCAALHHRSLWVGRATGVVDSESPLAVP